VQISTEVDTRSVQVQDGFLRCISNRPCTVVGEKRASSPESAKGPILNARNLVNVRQRVGQISQWAGPASDSAVAAANAIEVVMNTLLPSNTTLLKKFSWPLEVQTGYDSTDSGVINPSSTFPKDQRIFLQVEVEVVQMINKKFWQADVDQIEAILSLWLRHAHGSEEAIPKKERDSGKPETNWLRHKPQNRACYSWAPTIVCSAGT